MVYEADRRGLPQRGHEVDVSMTKILVSLRLYSTRNMAVIQGSIALRDGTKTLRLLCLSSLFKGYLINHLLTHVVIIIRPIIIIDAPSTHMHWEINQGYTNKDKGILLKVKPFIIKTF